MDGLNVQAELYGAADALTELQLDYWHDASRTSDPAEQASLLEDAAALDEAAL